MEAEAGLDHINNNNNNNHHHHHHGPENDDYHQQQLRQQHELKRSSLPSSPHAAARHTKRLTLNFPINIPAAAGTASMMATPSASSPNPFTPLTRHSSGLGTPLPTETTEDDSTNLLTAIASQERKVLELREELQRAEMELGSLKKQWTLSEKSKKPTEMNYHAEPLVSLRSPVENDEQQQQQLESAQRNKELDRLERRRSMRSSMIPGTSISANGRRVFQGSHARTLSLVSASTDSAFSKPASSSGIEYFTRTPRSATLPSSIERNSNNGGPGPSVPSSIEPTEDMLSQWRTSMPPPSKEMLMRTGKQMASDLREGLWTFLDDIRQATVGEEGINATEVRGVPSPVPRNRNSSSTSRSRDRLSAVQGMPSVSSSSASSRGRSRGATGVSEARLSGKDTQSTDIDSSFWSEFGIDTPGQKSPSNRAHHAHPTRRSNRLSGRPHDDSNHLAVDDEDWNNDWDTTPQPKKVHTPSSSRSTFDSKQDQSPRSQASSRRTSTSFGDWRPTSQSEHIPDPSVSDGIPWPAITKLAPSKLTRTASNLMTEWERSLSPSPAPGSASPTLEKESKKD